MAVVGAEAEAADADDDAGGSMSAYEPESTEWMIKNRLLFRQHASLRGWDEILVYG